MDSYLSLIRTDAAALATAARGRLADPVPSCPGWTVADLVDHVGHVYLHKIECIRQQRDPEPWPPPPHDKDPIDRLEAATQEMLAELAERGPDAPSYTWHEPDQTVGFWYRRMAQETAVHRADAELAVGAAGPVDSDLALDGVDELLDVFFAGDWSDLPKPDLVGRVGLRSADRSWLVVMDPEEVRIEPLAGDNADAVVSGEPSDLLLWLWGRLPAETVQVAGDAGAVDRLRRRLVLATQ
ncbi:MAG: maleylpyruvate isomerase family mycothiol-dependent enzyme [Actinomycetota bacterium]|nr:maleylpyruvate isomerase family mycothiol-dependent enzyme [Actinomycetota bacterium]